MTESRGYAVAGACGAGLTIAILAMSVLLRLGTRIEGGEAVSMLAPAAEHAARIAHRVAAMGVTVFAVLAVMLVAKERPAVGERVAAVALVVALTVALAVAGRYTPGYRFDAVTVLNVVGGIVLAAAFWWLRADARTPRDGFALTALVTLLAIAGSGAAADAAAMRGEPAYGPFHLWLAGFFVGLALAVAWRHRQRRLVAGATAALALLQLVLGFFLVGERALALAWGHAMLGCVLALLLATLASSRST